MQQTCATCGARSADADSLYALIGEHGWRPLWHEGSIQHPTVEWFCHACWEKYKEDAMRRLPSSGRVLAQAAAEDKARNAKPTPGRAK